MPSFSYLARDQFGELKAGFLISGGREEALVSLEDAGYIPMEIESSDVHDGEMAMIEPDMSVQTR